MFKYLVVFGAIGWFGYSVATTENSVEIQAAHLAECQATHGAENIKRVNSFTETAKCYFTDAYKEEIKLAEAEADRKAEAERQRQAQAAEAERQRQAEAKRIAEAEYRNSPEGKTEAFTNQAFTLCRQDVRARAKFPSKVDFNIWSGNSKKYWMNFSEGKSRVMIQNSGEMMNGFGNMIPFTATCKYDFDPATNKYSVVEVLI